MNLLKALLISPLKWVLITFVLLGIAVTAQNQEIKIQINQKEQKEQKEIKIQINQKEQKEILEDNHVPTIHVIKATEYLKNPLNAKDRFFIKFLSDYNGESKEDINILNWTINQLHLETEHTLLKEIYPNLYALDIRDFGWNNGAWQTISRREPYFRQPFIDFNNAIELGELSGVEQDPITLHLETIIRADWFFRESIESDRSQTYYDLLYAKFRFILKNDNNNEPEYITEIIEENWQGGIDPTDGKFYPKGKYSKEIKKQNKKFKTNEGILAKDFKFIKFPKNEADFEKAFGVDKVFDFIKESKINVQKGAVVEGGEKKVSLVARQNRLIAFTNGPIGIYSKTFDVKRTSKNRDFAETLNKNFEFDAGEILTITPCGGLAALLVNNKGDIVEAADNRFATDKSDITYDARVRTPGSCFICHESAFINPPNLVKEMLEKGTNINFKNKKDALDARSFFLSWDRLFESWQLPHKILTEKTFKDVPGKRAKAFKLYRDRYDDEIDLDKAARELYIPKAKFILAAGKSTKARILNLIVGISMPRVTWEDDGFFEMVKLLNSKELERK